MSGSTARLQAIGAVKGYEPPDKVFSLEEEPGQVFGSNVFSKDGDAKDGYRSRCSSP